MSIEDIIREGAGELRVNLDDGQIESFVSYLELLKFWNKRINLTSIEGDEEIAVLHFLDSLTIIPFISESSGVLDIGSGAGFPGMPIKIALPSVHVTMIDAVEKKVFFMKEAIRKLGLRGIEAVHCRAEDPNNGVPRGSFNHVVSRAVAGVGEMLDLSAPYSAPGGRIILMRGAKGAEEWDEANARSGKFRLLSLTELKLPFGGQKRVILTVLPKINQG